jgi:long-chain acyl-CoA synthetase
MAERTILDFYRHDFEAARQQHYRHFLPDGVRTLSTEQFFMRTASVSAALAELGIGTGDRVMLLSDNRPEWHQVDLATLALGGVDVPIYSTLTPDQIAYQAVDSGATVAIVENREQMAKFLRIRERCPQLRHLVQIEGECEHGVLSYDDLIRGASAADLESRFWTSAKQVDPHALMTIIYTSGTTGEPKGVMLTHDNLVQNTLHSAHRVPVRRDDLALEFLPLCHVLERMVSYIYMWRATSKAYCSVHHVGDLISQIQPTLMAGVPRFYEKVQQKILDTAANAPTVKRALFKWALDVGMEASRTRLAGRVPSGALAIRHNVADRLVLSKIRGALGGRLRYCLSGGAELPMFVAEFFHAVGVPILEGYGLTETSPVIGVNGAAPGELRLGTVGKPLENLEVKLASDGELLVKGPSVMRGYWNKPAQTAEVFDADGFFATGDIAEIDDDGFLLIVDRKKDLIVTAGGKNVAPQPIESELKRSPFVDAAVLIGDRRPYIVALFSPNFEELERWAKANGVDTSDVYTMVRNPAVERLFADAVDGVNASLARYEQVKKFRVLPVALTIDDGHLTPTMKVKRRVISDEFADVIDDLYAD